MTAQQTLAAFVTDLETADIPDRVRDRAGLTIADTVGAILGGSRDETVQSLASEWSQQTTGSAAVLGTEDVMTAPHLAAFCNGTAGTVLELDEGHRFAAGHPAIHVLPALLTETDASGEDLLRSFVAGYEVAVRTAEALGPLAEGYHTHGVWGAVGGAAAVASSRGLSASQVETAMAIAANYAQHTRFEAATEGATVRNSYAGMSNLASLVAVDQAMAGFSGLDGGVLRHLELASAEGVSEEALWRDLGERWEIERGYFKVHSACRYTHAVLDAVLSMREDIDPATVEAVTVGTYPAAARLTETRPQNALQARFSIPFAVGTALHHGNTDPDAFSTDAIPPAVLELAECVTVTVDEEVAARAPEQRGANVTVETTSGTIAREVRTPRGGEHRPLSESQLREKFEMLVAPLLGSERTEQLWQSARQPETPRRLTALAQR